MSYKSNPIFYLSKDGIYTLKLTSKSVSVNYKRAEALKMRTQEKW